MYKLYSMQRSGNCYKVRLALAQLGIAYDIVDIDTLKGEARGGDRLDRAHRVALDAGDLDEAADRITCEPEIMLHANFGGILDLAVRAAESGHQPPGGH